MPLLLLRRFGNLFCGVILLLASTLINMQLIFLYTYLVQKKKSLFFHAFISTIYLNSTRVLLRYGRQALTLVLSTQKPDTYIHEADFMLPKKHTQTPTKLKEEVVK